MLSRRVDVPRAQLGRVEGQPSPLLARAQRRLGPDPLDRRPGPLGGVLDQGNLLPGPVPPVGDVDGHPGHEPAAFDQRHVHMAPHLDGRKRRLLAGRPVRLGGGVRLDDRAAVEQVGEQGRAEGGDRVSAGERPDAGGVIPLDDVLVAADLEVDHPVRPQVLAQHPAGLGLHVHRIGERA